MLHKVSIPCSMFRGSLQMTGVRGSANQLMLENRAPKGILHLTIYLV